MAGIDNNSLTERELLLLLAEKVDRFEAGLSQIVALQLKVAQLETKITMYSAFFGVVSTVASSLIVYFFTKN